VEEAIAAYRQAIQLFPKLAAAHWWLGGALREQRKWDGAIAAYREAVLLHPSNPVFHRDLGVALARKGLLDEAIAAYRQAIKLAPKFTEAQAGLMQTQRLAALLPRLPDFLAGKYQPRNNVERLDLARLCEARQLHRSCAKLYADAFAADAKLADLLHAGYRYDAAWAAALAGCGQGKDAAGTPDEEKSRLRGLALRWLNADLAGWAKQLQSGKPADRAWVQSKLRQWQQDTDLIGVRDREALEKLSAEEQQAWRKLWADVVALLQEAQRK
jgi:serine/threonine-protein kinase